MTKGQKTIVITGASSGIGYATAQLLAEKGHIVYAIARREEKLNHLASLKKYKGRIIPVPFDLGKFDSNLLDSFFKEVSTVDVLINNAGLLLNEEFLKITEEQILEVFNLNFVSVVKAIQYFHSRLKNEGFGHIVNISSVGGVTGSVKFPGLSMYSSSKGALSILSECLAQDFNEDGIKVNCLALGSANTQMLKDAFPDFNSPTSPEEMAEYIVAFSLEAHRVINGVTQVVSASNP